MSCCGKQRQTFHPGPSAPVGAAGVAEASPRATSNRRSHAYFQYIGATGLTVQGPATGTWYRFDRRGAIVAVALHDRRSLAAVPALREVRGFTP